MSCSCHTQSRKTHPNPLVVHLLSICMSCQSQFICGHFCSFPPPKHEGLSKLLLYFTLSANKRIKINSSWERLIIYILSLVFTLSLSIFFSWFHLPFFAIPSILLNFLKVLKPHFYLEKIMTIIVNNNNNNNTGVLSLKVSKEWDICWRLRRRLKCPLFHVWEGPKNSRRVPGHAPPENLLNSQGMHRRVRHLSFKRFLALFATSVHVIMVSLS